MEKNQDCTELFRVSVSETMAARGLVNGRGPRRRRGRDSAARRVVSETDTLKSSPDNWRHFVSTCNLSSRKGRVGSLVVRLMEPKVDMWGTFELVIATVTLSS